jgi:hypothetical protein
MLDTLSTLHTTETRTSSSHSRHPLQKGTSSFNTVSARKQRHAPVRHRCFHIALFYQLIIYLLHLTEITPGTTTQQPCRCECWLTSQLAAVAQQVIYIHIQHASDVHLTAPAGRACELLPAAVDTSPNTITNTTSAATAAAAVDLFPKH